MGPFLYIFDTGTNSKKGASIIIIIIVHMRSCGFLYMGCQMSFLPCASDYELS